MLLLFIQGCNTAQGNQYLQYVNCFRIYPKFSVFALIGVLFQGESAILLDRTQTRI